MAVTLVYRGARAKIDALELDASVSEHHQTQVEVTDHPVEQGVAISDHRRRKPDTITIEGIVSNTALPDPSAGLTQQRSNGQDFLSRSIRDTGKAEDAYSQLLDLADSTTLITVVTAIRTYENMTLTELSLPRDARSGDSIRFTATFREIRVVQNATVQVQTSTPRGKPKKDLVKKAPTKATDQEMESSLHVGKVKANAAIDAFNKARAGGASPVDSFISAIGGH